MTRVTFEVHVVLDNDLKEISEEVLANDLENYREIPFRTGGAGGQFGN
jgi:hypothetical protein